MKPVEVDINKTIGNRTRQLRFQLGLSQAAVAKELGRSVQQVQKYEKGTSHISVPRLLQLCAILQTTPNEIIGWKAPPSEAINNYTTTLFKAARDFTKLPEELQIIVRQICDILLARNLPTKKKR